MTREGRRYVVVVVLDLMADMALDSLQWPTRLPRGPADDDEVSTLFFSKAAFSTAPTLHYSAAHVGYSHAPGPKRKLKLRARGIEQLLEQALHSSSVAFTVARAHSRDADAELVWCSRGFEGMSGYSTHYALGKNCRFLQTDATDPQATSKMRIAIDAGRAERVIVYNERRDHSGFWNLISLYPVRYAEPQASRKQQYYIGWLVGFDSATYRTLVWSQHHVLSNRQAAVDVQAYTVEEAPVYDRLPLG
uniref:PAS domain-containing protein n=1 Tax=Prymnesium polylepis TaxID=72548 RepID=A0A6T8DP81_9EUKA